ncbi:hypothetical protein [Clostridium sp.]|uniref:hypothetical protein n=1 Tax=Clostridium sp. TaxID=1506 RepID=UPI002FDEC70B
MSSSHIIGNPDSAIWKMLGIDDPKTTNTKQKSIDINKENTENRKSQLTTNCEDDKIQK